MYFFYLRVWGGRALHEIFHGRGNWKRVSFLNLNYLYWPFWSGPSNPHHWLRERLGDFEVFDWDGNIAGHGRAKADCGQQKDSADLRGGKSGLNTRKGERIFEEINLVLNLRVSVYFFNVLQKGIVTLYWDLTLNYQRTKLGTYAQNIDLKKRRVNGQFSYNKRWAYESVQYCSP